MSLRICTSCGRKKLPSEFYKDTTVNSGLRCNCKSCMLGYQEKYRNTESGKLVFKKARKKYRVSLAGAEKHRVDSRLRRRKHPERQRAHNILNYAVLSGRVTRQGCCFCYTQVAEAHHEDCNKPLDVVWLCNRCHNFLHANRRKEQENGKAL